MASYRMTPQRMAVKEVLSGNRDHPSAEEVFRAVRRRYPTISLATVYNTLDFLAGRGEVRRLTIDPQRRRYDPDVTDHHHIICRSCGRVGDVRRSIDLPLTEAEKDGFTIEGNHVEFYGLCAPCYGKEVKDLAEFKCEKCGATKEGRCKPKTCPSCGGSGTMQKQS